MKLDRELIDARNCPTSRKAREPFFVAGLLSSYDRYLSAGEPDLVRDGVSYSMSALWLSDDEHTRMLQDLAAAVATRAEFGPSAERKRRLIATAFMPLADTVASPAP